MPGCRRSVAGSHRLELAERTVVPGYVGDGAERWPAGHRADAARLVRLALGEAPAGSAVHAVGEEGIPACDIAEAIGRRLDVPVASVAAALQGRSGTVGGVEAADLFDRLRREPDVEAPDLVAVDATDRLLLDEAAELLAAAGPGEQVVVDDSYGALTLGAVAAGARDVRVHQDPLVGELALARNAERTGLTGTYRSLPLGRELADGARLVLAKAPRSLDALRELTEVVAASAAPDVTLLVGGRVKHMTHAMNDVLGVGFTDVHATLARQKSRVLVARGPRPGVTSSFPRCQEHPDPGLTVCAHGAAFAGTKVDAGTRALLAALPEAAPDARTALDLGCGTGVLATALALARPGLTVLASDQSASAVASAEATAAANGVAARVRVARDDAASTVADASVDLVVCNPPFHLGAAVVTGAADRLFAAAGRVLRPGGELWSVYNNRLPHRAALRRLVGPTRVAASDRRFTVAVSTRR